MTRAREAVVVGAGVAGATAALALRRKGLAVTLIDAWAPGHPRASSSGVHRLLRCSHGRDRLYTEWAYLARERWLELGQETGQELFVQAGVVLLAKEGHTEWEDTSQESMTALGIPHFVTPPEELGIRLPVVNTEGFAYGLWEPESGFVWARQGVLAAIAQFQREGGVLERGNVQTDDAERPVLDGRPLDADLIVMACGPWLGSLFPRTLRPMLTVVRQDIVMVQPPPGDTRYDVGSMPGWIDHGYPAYGIPAVGGHGFKAAIAWHQTDIDLDHEDRFVDATGLARSRRYLATRFPGLEQLAITQQTVCQITNTADTHFLIDFHPEHDDVLFFGGGSGHLYKHGMVAGEFAAGVAMREHGTNQRFRYANRTAVDLADRPQ